MEILSLNLKKMYFDDIRRGNKNFEYRLMTSYWKKRLEGVEYDEVHFKMGYPKNDEHEKIVKCKYKGYEVQTITHEHFNDIPEKVYAIIVEL